MLDQEWETPVWDIRALESMSEGFSKQASLEESVFEAVFNRGVNYLI